MCSCVLSRFTPIAVYKICMRVGQLVFWTLVLDYRETHFFSSFQFVVFFQINLMTERKMDLERRIELLQGEREGLSSTLDESADRIIMLEKQSREQDSLVRTADWMNLELIVAYFSHNFSPVTVRSYIPAKCLDQRLWGPTICWSS